MHIRFTHITDQSELFFYISRPKLYHLSKTTCGGFKIFADEGPFPTGWNSDMKNWSASATSISTMEGVIEVIREFVMYTADPCVRKTSAEKIAYC